MSEFTDSQAALQEAQRQRSNAKGELFSVEEKLRKLRRQRDELKRRIPTQSGSDELEEVDRQERDLARSAKTLTGRAGEADRLVLDREALFEAFSDPTENIARLDDRFPILLFPLRIETRFKQVELDDTRVHQLWIRVYPDDIAVDTFEEMLAEVEVKNARIYWINVWKAGGDEGKKRAAWQSLAKSHGAGRAHWIISQVAPTNAEDEPVKTEGEHLLVIVTEDPLPDAEKPVVAAYWRDVYLAANEQSALDTAFTALVSALGQARAETVGTDYVPQNLTVAVKDAETVSNLRVEFLELPALEEVPTQQQPWMRPANTALLPERFVVLGFNDGEQTLQQIGNPVPSELVIGPNPTAKPEEQLRLEDDELVVPEELKWMVDFDEAVAQGMGFRINLSPSQALAGFDRLFVLGVRLGADLEAGTQQLETLIRNHQRSRKGFSILRQGAPTNNVEDQESGYTWRTDSDSSYDHYFVQDWTDDPTDWRRKKDGRWLAEYLGVDPEVLKASPNYFATDQCEARALNEALWPATLGYFMEQMMEPVFAADSITSTRAYFNRYVLGRGAVPAIRIGHQPYGILPATPYSRMGWLRREILASDRLNTGIPNQFSYLSRLYALVRKADETWSALSADVSYVGKPETDPHQALLDVVGLHPSSVEFYQRYAESAEQLYNRFKLSGSWGAYIAALVTLGHAQSGLELLEILGHTAGESEELPDILNKFFLKSPNLLKGPFIDDRPLSETEAIRAYHTDGSNYIEWLIGAARDSHDTLRKQQGFIDERPPTALLYLMLRHALDIGYVDAALQLHVDADLLTTVQVAQAKRQTSFIHIEDAQRDSGSEWQYLYKAEPAITNDPQMRVAEFVPRILSQRNPYLNTQLEALEHLSDVPTARLERAFAEHLDCCTYRLDAWWLGLLNVQLSLMRSEPTPAHDSLPDGDGATPRGSYLGAFGWLENVQPENKQLRPVKLDDELDAIFNKDGQPRVVEDLSNFGYIHAPSLNHAVAAAVLRNGYLSNATPDNPETLSINLTSERVRLALSVIEGIRNGQSLSALLGYQLERGLHDREGLFLDSLILELRKQFPLAGDRFITTRTDPSVRIDAVEARNVVDGLALVEHVQARPVGDRGYPFGLADKLPEITDADALAAIDTEVEKIMNINDAVADLAMAEGVYQVVQGNYDRAASTMDAYSKGHFPPTPEVVQTPRSGVTLTHRVAIHLRAGLDPDDSANETPRSKGEPAVNAWLADCLPPMNQVFCVAEFFNHATAAMEIREVTAEALDLLPVDLLYMLNMDGEQQMRALDDRILLHVLQTAGLRADVEIEIRYREKKAGMISFFELAPYLANLRALLLRSRALRATDARLPNEAAATEERTAVVRLEKVTRVRDLLGADNADLTALVAQLGSMLDDPDESVVEANAVDNIDQIIGSWADVAGALNRFGLSATGVAFAYDWRRRQFTALMTKLDALIELWQTRLAEFDERLTEYVALPPSTSDQEKTTLLLQAAMLITTETVTPPASGDPDDLLTTLGTTQRPAFAAALAASQGIRDTEVEVSGLYRALAASAATVAAHDLQPLELEEDKTAIIAFAKTVQSKAGSLSTDVSERLAAADALVSGDTGADAVARVDELMRAAKQLLGEDFVILPEFALGTDHGAEWQKAYDEREQLLDFLKNEEGVDFPEDDWLYGIARVREKMHHLESATMFSEALNDKPIPLAPLQLPCRENDAWLGLKFPDKRPGLEEPFTIDEDKLLYTAHYHDDFDQAQAMHCGVLVDEWTEVIPTSEETTGLAFHYDRPNSEPPQTVLLAMPADFIGSWNWQDLVDTLHETLDLARKRAVEPQHVDDTPYARFLPATVSSVTTFPIALALNLAFNNAIQFNLETP